MADGLRQRASALWSRYRNSLLAFVAGGAAAGVIVAIGALAVIQLGLYNTAAAQQHNKLVSWALHKTFKNSVKLRAGNEPASAFTKPQIISGFRQYQADCVMCHGGPGVARAHWVQGLEPTPPFLLDSGKRWTAAQLDYILEKGVKMSAMPAWGETRSRTQIMDIVAFLKALPNISPAQFAKLQSEYPAIKAAGSPLASRNVPAAAR